MTAAIQPGIDPFETLRAEGFSGFAAVASLWADKSALPKQPGVYVVLSPTGDLPEFLPVGTGGQFQGRNPNVMIGELIERWRAGEPILYIGKAGGSEGASTLEKRIGQLLDFGRRKPVGHWGGRYLWQIRDADRLVIAWRVIDHGEPGDIEAAMIEAFMDRVGALPFANLRRARAAATAKRRLAKAA